MVISEATKARIQDEILKYPKPGGALLFALHAVQKETGYIAPATARELAQIFGVTPIHVMEVVSFYNMFYDKPQGRHHVHVCTNLPCSLRGGRDLLHGLEAHLGVGAGETTTDGRITLGHEECLGACGYAPMLRIDETYHEDLDLASAKQLVDALK